MSQHLQQRWTRTTLLHSFQVNGPVGLANWKDYCADLSSSEIYNQLTSKDYALEEDGKVYGIAYVIETYGIIYNRLFSRSIAILTLLRLRRLKTSTALRS